MIFVQMGDDDNGIKYDTPSFQRMRKSNIRKMSYILNTAHLRMMRQKNCHFPHLQLRISPVVGTNTGESVDERDVDIGGIDGKADEVGAIDGIADNVGAMDGTAVDVGAVDGDAVDDTGNILLYMVKFTAML